MLQCVSVTNMPTQHYSSSSLCLHVFVRLKCLICACAERRNDCNKGGDGGKDKEDTFHHQKERRVNGE